MTISIFKITILNNLNAKYIITYLQESFANKADMFRKTEK